MEGNAEATIIRKMHTKIGYAPLVIETILSMIESSVRSRRLVHGLHLDRENRKAYVTFSGVNEHFRSLIGPHAGGREALSEKVIGKVLRGLAEEDPCEFKKGGMVWTCLDILLLLEEALESGHNHLGLVALMEGTLPPWTIKQESNGKPSVPAAPPRSVFYNLGKVDR